MYGQGMSQYVRQRELHETELVNGLDLTSSRTTAAFSVAGYNQLTVEIDLSSQNTVTRVDMGLETSGDGGTTWHAVQSATVVAGGATLDDLSYQKTVGDADQWAINLATNYDLMRLTFSVGAGAGTSTDVITVKGRLGVL